MSIGQNRDQRGKNFSRGNQLVVAEEAIVVAAFHQTPTSHLIPIHRTPTHLFPLPQTTTQQPKTLAQLAKFAQKNTT